MSMGHTPTPWRVADYLTAGSDARPILCGDKEWPCVVCVDIRSFKSNPRKRAERDANAALIVRAVNAHDELVRALEDAERTLAHAYALEGWESLSESLAVARAALQKARA